MDIQETLGWLFQQLETADYRGMVIILDLIFISTFQWMKRWVPEGMRLQVSLALGAAIGVGSSILGGDPQVWDTIVMALSNAAAPAGFYRLKQAYDEARKLKQNQAQVEG